MKKIILILVLLLSIKSNGQDIFNPKPIIHKDSISNFNAGTNKFTLGWNWGGNRKALN